MAKGDTTQYNFKNEKDIPFTFEQKNSGFSGFAYLDGTKYKVLTHILCGEYYNTQPGWWKDGHNIELQEI